MGNESTHVEDDVPAAVIADEVPRAEPRDPATTPRLIVGVGASAGGLEAFRSFFTHMPADSGMGFVLVQHLSPDHKSMLAELLGRSTEMRVVEAQDGQEVTRDCVFVIPPDATMTISEGRLQVTHPAPPRGDRRPINSFLESLAADRGEHAVGIILSGTGSDGSIGVTAIKDNGGLTIAQGESDHQALAGMPQSATSTGQVDEVLQVEDMPGRLLAHAAHLRTVAAKKDGDGARIDASTHLEMIMRALHARTGHDFTEYKEKTLLRRLQRRMQILQIETPDAYIALIKDNPAELDLLFSELLISVTHFFRDPAAFDHLNEAVLEKLVASKNANDDIRIWVPGCATGEEAYTLAILLREAMPAGHPRPRVQIFGTDIDDRAIAFARQGRYRAPIAGIADARLERWFSKDGDICTVVSEIREMCVFSAHSVIKHPPFSRLDLISCRNLLIYVAPAVQNRILRTFHYALKPGGYLFLGSSESVTRSDNLFTAINKRFRIFERRAIDGPSLPDISGGVRSVERARPPGPARTASDDRIDKSARRVMDKYRPPHIVVDQDHQIVRFSGGAMGSYLEPAAGTPSFALFDILRKPLRAPVRAILQEVLASNKPVRHESIQITADGQSRLLSLLAEPISDRVVDAGLIVLAFQDNGTGYPGDNPTLPSDASQALEHELRTTKAQLQASIDELEFANEEMKSSNEEYQSVNEELQSSNEELETAKEEMQSINEELQTINAEMTSKNDQLARLNSDLKNLLESTEIASLFLDASRRVRSFTVGMTDIFHLRENDIGRPITEIVSRLDYDGLQRDVSIVLRKLTVIEREVKLRDSGMTFILRIRPYRTIDNLIDGVVLTFMDITERGAADAVRLEADAYLRLLIDSTADGIYCIDGMGTTTLCNASFLRMLGFKSEADVIGRKLHDIIHHSHPDGTPYRHDDCPVLITARTGEPAHRDDEEFYRADGQAFPVEYWVRPIIHAGQLNGAVCSFIDASERRLAEEQQGLLLRELDHRVKNLFAIMSGVVTLSARSSKTPQELAETIQGRLGALASAHMLIRTKRPGMNNSGESTLGELVTMILAPHLDSVRQSGVMRTSIEGPDLVIDGDAMTSFALVLHELATNAAKYGALSTASGSVGVAWTIDGADLHLTWRESGGPPLTGPPQREGFGSLLARRSVTGQLKGKLSFDWDPAGLIVRVAVPVERLKP